MFKTHINNIHGLRAAVNHFGKIWFHGDGNMYHEKHWSDNAKDFSNDPQGASTYRVEFNKGDKIPSTVEELNKMLMAAKNREAVEAATPKEVSGLATFKVEIPEENEEAEVKKGKKGSKKVEAVDPEANDEGLTD